MICDMEGEANERIREREREIVRSEIYNNCRQLLCCIGRGSLASDTRAKLNAPPFYTDSDYLFSFPDYFARTRLSSVSPVQS